MKIIGKAGDELIVTMTRKEFTDIGGFNSTHDEQVKNFFERGMTGEVSIDENISACRKIRNVAKQIKDLHLLVDQVNQQLESATRDNKLLAAFTKK